VIQCGPCYLLYVDHLAWPLVDGALLVVPVMLPVLVINTDPRYSFVHLSLNPEFGPFDCIGMPHTSHVSEPLIPVYQCAPIWCMQSGTPCLQSEVCYPLSLSRASLYLPTGIQLKPGVYLAPKTRLEDVCGGSGAAVVPSISNSAMAYDGSRVVDQAGPCIASSTNVDTGLGSPGQLLVSMRGPRRAASPLRQSHSPTAPIRDAADYSRGSQSPTTTQALDTLVGGAALTRNTGRATDRLRGTNALGVGMTSSSSIAASGLQSTAAMVSAAAADYSYPNMGYSQMVQSPQSFQAQLRGHELDVYGNQRTVSPPLPASHLRVRYAKLILPGTTSSMQNQHIKPMR
jgi:hypothetical protein